MTRAEREAFQHFIAWIKDAMAGLDGCVPVAFICMPVERVHADGGIDVRRDGDGRIIWPASFPVADRGPLLAGLARGYAAGAADIGRGVPDARPE